MGMSPENTEIVPPTPITLKPSTHQPSKAEQEETQDMPGWSLEKVRAAFFRPFQEKPEED